MAGEEDDTVNVAMLQARGQVWERFAHLQVCVLCVCPAKENEKGMGVKPCCIELNQRANLKVPLVFSPQMVELGTSV